MEIGHISLCVVQSENKVSFPTASLAPVCKDKCQPIKINTGGIWKTNKTEWSKFINSTKQNLSLTHKAHDELHWRASLEKVNHYASEGVTTIKTIRKIISNKY